MKQQRIRQYVLSAAGIFLGLWAFFRFLSPVLLPFGVGLAIAAAAEPLVTGLQNRLKLPRWLCAGVGVLAVYGLLALVLFLLCRLLCRELTGFVRTLPMLAQSLSGPVQALEQWLLTQAGRFPDGIGDGLQKGVSEFFRTGAGLTTKIYDKLFSFATGFLRRVPDITLFLLTAVLSGFMLAAELPELTALWKKKAPPAWQRKVETLLGRVKQTLGGWLKAQAKLMLICALILTTGLVILRVNYPLLFGIGIALIDALPVLGSGMVLIPWGLWMFLQGHSFQGAGLLCLYGAAALTRTALEPRLLGKQMGLNPLLTLLTLYAGYRFFGIAGMILFPMAAMLVKQFLSPREN